jgi:hypothetical protein
MAHSKVRNEMEWNGIPQRNVTQKVNPVFFFVLEWFGTSLRKFFLALNGSDEIKIVQNGNPSIFIFCGGVGNKFTKFQVFFLLYKMVLERYF